MSHPLRPCPGIFQCGPSPLKAIKHGEVHLPHDTPFVFAEVNADRVLWREEGPKKFSKVRTQTRSVGREISTKALGQDKREDITLQYKFPEGEESSHRAGRGYCSHSIRALVYPLHRWHQLRGGITPL